MDYLILGLWVLALARLTRLLIADEITDGIRARVFTRYGQHSRQGYFATCPWCVGLWLSLATTPYAIWLTGWSWWLYPLIAGAGSYVVGIFASRIEPDDDAEIEIIND